MVVVIVVVIVWVMVFVELTNNGNANARLTSRSSHPQHIQNSIAAKRKAITYSI